MKPSMFLCFLSTDSSSWMPYQVCFPCILLGVKTEALGDSAKTYSKKPIKTKKSLAKPGSDLGPLSLKSKLLSTFLYY